MLAASLVSAHRPIRRLNVNCQIYARGMTPAQLPSSGTASRPPWPRRPGQVLVEYAALLSLKSPRIEWGRAQGAEAPSAASRCQIYARTCVPVGRLNS